ncbi:tetratricopeptide repeat-containing glycosyltransferase family 2 protein [Paenibacillus sp. FSL M7-0420]|uniref:tetratricopeptide repeat-containing glycosyltransferase family 2 protein n=1 Tax=Paenibacillus sp. FSL M7-0420 TaxID=2921609 RepID=UPI0030F94E44
MTTKPQQPLISLCMIVKNEADNLARCLRSVRGAVDEIIIVDTGSTDTTCSIARSFGARIIDYPWNGDFAAARNAGLTLARGTWILVLDADEELEPGSLDELLVCAKHTEYEAFFVRIHNHQGTERASQTLTVNPILRMFKNRPNYRFSGIIHEQIAAVIVQETPDAAMHMGTVIVHHYGYAAGVVERKDKISRNLGLLKQQLEESPGDAFQHFNLAVEYMRLGDYGQALEHIGTSLNLAEPGTSYIHLLYKYKARCLAVTGDSPGALEACGQGSSLFPDYPDLHHLKGALLLQVSALAEAKAALRRALQIGASPPLYHTESGIGTYLTHTLLGQVCQQIGEDHEAAACFTRAAQLQPDPWLLIPRLTRLFKCTGREPELHGWLAGQLPGILTEQRQELLRLLVRDGCYTAAVDMLGGGVRAGVAAGEMDGGVQNAGEIDTVMRDAGASGATMQSAGALGATMQSAGEMDAGALGAKVMDSVMQGAGAVDDAALEVPPTTDLLELLQRAEAASAAELGYDDITGLLSHPAVVPADRNTEVPLSAIAAAVQPWILLADKVLAALITSAIYSPAAAAARLSLPLPRSAD